MQLIAEFSKPLHPVTPVLAIDVVVPGLPGESVCHQHKTAIGQCVHQVIKVLDVDMFDDFDTMHEINGAI